MKKLSNIAAIGLVVYMFVMMAFFAMAITPASAAKPMPKSADYTSGWVWVQPGTYAFQHGFGVVPAITQGIVGLPVGTVLDTIQVPASATPLENWSGGCAFISVVSISYIIVNNGCDAPVYVRVSAIFP
jgi:hypothetical protein